MTAAMAATQPQQIAQLGGKRLHAQRVAGTVVSELGQAGAGKLKHGKRRAQHGHLLFRIEAAGGGRRPVQLGRQAGAGHDPPKDRLQRALRRGRQKAALFQGGQRLLHLPRRVAGGRSQALDVGYPMASHVQEDVALHVGQFE
jgi:hypothetical protein